MIKDLARKLHEAVALKGATASHARKSVQEMKAKQGKDKIAANKGPIVLKGLGVALVKAMREASQGVRQSIVAIAKHNKETIAQSVLEVEGERKAEADKFKGKSKEVYRKRASISASYSRILTILRFIHAGVNTDAVLKAPSLPIMYAMCTNKSSKRTGRTQALTSTQFSKWTKATARIVGDVPERNATDEVKAKFAGQLARLEQHTRDCIAALAKHSNLTYLPVRDMLAMCASPRKLSVRLKRTQLKLAA